MAKCEVWDVVCQAGEAVGGAAGDLAKSALAPFITGIFQQAMETLKSLTTFWVDASSADVSNPAVVAIQHDLAWYTSFFALVGFLIGVIRLMVDFHRQGSVGNSVTNLLMPLWRIFKVSVIVGPGLSLAIKASDGLSKWLLERAIDGENLDFTKMFVSTSALMTNLGGAFILFVLLLLGAIVTWVFMLFRNVMFLILAVFLPTTAAASGTEAGMQAYQKSIGWLIALLLFKPVAAGIYALGFRLLVSDSGETTDTAAATTQMLTGLVVLLLAALALPALVKFVAPVAAGGGGFSGGAAAAGAITVAGGAALIAGTGGAAAPAVAGGASAAGAGGGSAAAATGAAGGAASTAGGASTPMAGSGPASSGGAGALSGSSGAGSPASSINDGAASASSPASAGSSGGSTSPSPSPDTSGSKPQAPSGAPAAQTQQLPPGSVQQGAGNGLPPTTAATAPPTQPGAAPASGAWKGTGGAAQRTAAQVNNAASGLAKGARAERASSEDES